MDNMKDLQQEILDALRDDAFRAKIKQMILQIEAAPDADAEENAKYGLFTSDALKETARAYSQEANYPLPHRFLPDLDWTGYYANVIERQPISDFRKSVYWHIAKGNSIVNWFLGRRADMPVPKLVPTGEGRGRARYGYQVADLPDDERYLTGAIQAAGVKNEADALEWLKNRRDALMGWPQDGE